MNKTLTVTGLATGLLSSLASPQSPVPHPVKPVHAGTTMAARYRPAQMPAQESRYYEMVWGIDALSVKLVESGELIRFSYFVLEPAKATTLNDKKLQPFLEDPQAGVKLVVPQMEQVGMLRQSSTPESGKSYWMAFSNKGGVVKRGDRIDVVIGRFRAEGLVVE